MSNERKSHGTVDKTLSKQQIQELAITFMFEISEAVHPALPIWADLRSVGGRGD